MQKYLTTFCLSFFLLLSMQVSGRTFQFTFKTDNAEDKAGVIVRYEIFDTQPTGFSPSNIRTTTLNAGQTIALALKGNQSIIFEVVYEQNSKRISLPISFKAKELSKKLNTINLVFYEQKDQNDYKTMAQLVDFLRQEQYAKYLVNREANAFQEDVDLPVGSLIFYDGEKAYYANTIGIVGEQELNKLNERNYVLQDLVKIEQGASLDVQAQLGGFLSRITANVDFSQTKFMEYRLEIVNLGKRQVKTYLRNPNTIFAEPDPWLEAVLDILSNNQQEIGKYKLFFVTAKIVADTVKIQQRIYKETATTTGTELKGAVMIDIGAEGRYSSEKSFTELDTYSNLYFDYEVRDLTLVMMYEFRKRLNERQKQQFTSQKQQLNQQLYKEKEKLLENFELVKLYDDQLPIANPSYTQLQSIYGNQPLRLPKDFPTDSLGNPLADENISNYNLKVENYNKFLLILQGNLKKCQALEENIASVDVLITQLDNPSQNNQEVPESPSKTLDKTVMQNIEEKVPEK